MAKLFLSISAILASLALLLVAFKQETPQTLGSASSLKELIQVASTSATQTIGTYFGQATGADSRPTTTLLTLERVHNYDRVGLEIQNVATQTPGTIYVQPQVSNDASTWFDWNPTAYGAGPVVNQIVLGAATSTYLVWPPVNRGTTTTQYVFDIPVARYIRFQVWTSGTSTVALFGWLQL